MPHKQIQISIDLVEAALAQRQFLQLVDIHPSLYAGPHVQNAIRRYELFWLPLLAQSCTAQVTAPLDIAWVWHVHMLSPVNYEMDCNEIVSTLVDHKILIGVKRERGLETAMALWKELYPREPFEVDLTAPVSIAPGFESRIQYDIAAACSRQRVFYYQVSLPHYGDKKFLNTALARYKQHLFLKQQNPDMFLVPCYDFDLIWHAHQPGSKLTKSDKATREKWKGTGQNFAVNGAMFRGEPPLWIQAGPIDYTWLAALDYTVDLTRLEIEGLSMLKSYTVTIDVLNGEQILKTRVRGPSARVFNPTVCYRRSRLTQRRATASGVPYKSTAKPEPVTHELTIADNLIIRFTTVAHPPRLDRYYITVGPEKHFSSTVQHPAQILNSPTLMLPGFFGSIFSAL
ncbi:hypothetical protein OS493_018821 [Desmophyllum pertusum]|uniref:Uncharacterized protein n=1 Tax=Desmophyllum pertusum TaxID=174260 RepID=A0A9W9ZCF9_9CNID|nr:hypothetical protein OS493_018821 [Desmophyllum pertusum]